MKSKKGTKKELSRRDFIKTTLVGAGATAFVGLRPNKAKAQMLPRRWDKEADIVVVGFGAAGAVTAIAAHDLGAQVLLLDKAPESEAGGNTRVAGGEVYSHQDVESAIAYLTALNGPFVVPRDHIETWAYKLKDNGNFMRDVLGCTTVTWRPWEEFPELPGVKNSGCWIVGPKPASGWGKDLYALLRSNVYKRGIEVLYETPATELIQNPRTKEILGVKVESGGWDKYIKARKAVVLTCGGFENNQEMVRDYLHLPYCYPKGTYYNTGDGIRMALDVGADLWHMGNMAGPDFNFKAPEMKMAFGYAMSALLRRNCITVGANSKRFWNEAAESRHGKILSPGGIWVGTPMPLPVHAIFDETARLAGPIYTSSGTMAWWTVMNVYTWSQDNSAEIQKGWIIQADTIRELATKIGRDPDVLEATVNRYNAFCEAGEDPDFGRPKARLLPIKTPPFYAMELSPTFTNTQGGPRRNKYAQVLDKQGKPIPRLYSAGELGSMYSDCYNGGMNLGECFGFGRIAAENAVALAPWS